MANKQMQERVAPEVQEREAEVEDEEGGAAPPTEVPVAAGGSGFPVILWIVIPLALVLLWEAVISKLID